MRPEHENVEARDSRFARSLSATVRPRRLVVGTDFSASAALALDRATFLPLAEYAELVVVHVAGAGRTYPASELESLVRRASTTTKEALRARGRADVTVRASIVPGDPQRRLPALASELGADLLVVGRGDQSLARRWIRRPLAEPLLRGELPVLVAGRHGHVPYETVLAAVRLDEDAPATIGAAASLAAFHGAQLHVLHAYEPLSSSLLLRGGAHEAAVEAYEREARDEALAALESFVAEAAPGRSVIASVVRGTPQNVIDHWLEGHAADLVVLGPPRHSRLERLFLGDIATSVLHSDRCDLLRCGSSPKPA